MTNIICIYLLGLCVVGLIMCKLFQSDQYVERFTELTNETRKDTPGADFISDETIIKYDIILTSLFSWLGLISVIVSILDYYIWLNKKK